MTSEKYDQLDEATREREQLVEEMRGVRDHFVTTFAEELPDRWDEIARRWITSFPEDVKQLGKDGLGNIKAEISALSDRAREIAETHLSGTTVWSHEAATGAYKGDRYEMRNFLRIRQPMAKAENEIQEILSPRFSGRIAIPLESRLSENLKDIIETYGEQHRRLTAFDERINRLTHEIDREEAETLWDEA